jgi:vesicle coat complex subunit
MILVCDAYRKDLLHPNEYVRGSTLRYLFMILFATLTENIFTVFFANCASLNCWNL